MRKLIASVLLLTVTVGCTTTTRARVAGAPPAPGSKDARQVTGLVLQDGTEVEFRVPAELRPDGSVMGSVPAEYTGALEDARAYRLAVYEADQIAAYKLGKQEKKADGMKTAGAVVLGLGVLFGIAALSGGLAPDFSGMGPAFTCALVGCD